MNIIPSFRQRVSTYFRQLSFINEPQEDSRLFVKSEKDGNFITRYLEGSLKIVVPSPEIVNKKEPLDMPDYSIKKYPIGIETVTAAYTGPDEGLTAIRRSKNHLSAGPEIDFIDTNQEQDLCVRQGTSNANCRGYYRRQYNINNNSSSVTTKKNIPKSGSSTLKQNPENVINKNNETIITEALQEQIQHLNTNEEKNDQNIAIAASSSSDDINLIAGLPNWNMSNEHAYGIAESLYEKNPITNEDAGSPIADCFGLVVRNNVAALALADGVNWGDKARLAAQSAVHSSLEYLNTAVFGIGPGGMATSTREIFVSLLRSFWEAHDCILENGGALSTLTVAVILPLADSISDEYVVCSCNVGDSLGYVYSKIYGVREFTQGSHDITSMRDMRDALGALGPVDGKSPELSNLTLSITKVVAGDIVFLTSDGISDNFDPVVGKFAEAFAPGCTTMTDNEPNLYNKHDRNDSQWLAPKRQNKSSSAIFGKLSGTDSFSPRHNDLSKSGSSSVVSSRDRSRPASTTGHKMTKKLPDNQYSRNHPPPVFNRSLTVIEPNIAKRAKNKYLKSKDGLPIVTAAQRHALTLLRLDDLLSHGINGTLRQCSSAKNLCHILVDFVQMITSAKRKILEQRELFYKSSTRVDGTRTEIELNRIQQKRARKKVISGTTFSFLPGKLDHATVVAFTVGGGIITNSNTIGLHETEF